MKPLNIIKPAFVILFVITTGICSSFAIEPSATCAEKMHEKLKENIKYPSSSLRDAIEGEVQVIFTLTSEGQVTICHIYGTSIDLVNYIKEKLSSIRCKEMTEAYNQYFKVKFNFHLI
jgi:hypothetical protein